MFFFSLFLNDDNMLYIMYIRRKWQGSVPLGGKVDNWYCMYIKHNSNVKWFPILSRGQCLREMFSKFSITRQTLFEELLYFHYSSAKVLKQSWEVSRWCLYVASCVNKWRWDVMVGCGVARLALSIMICPCSDIRHQGKAFLCSSATQGALHLHQQPQRAGCLKHVAGALTGHRNATNNSVSFRIIIS